MKKLGFVQGCTEAEIEPVHFFFQNIPKFLQLAGLSVGVVNCGVRQLNAAENVVIAFEHQNSLQISIDRNLISAITEVDDGNLIGKLWYYNTTALRLFAINHHCIDVNNLIPAHLLYSTPDVEDLRARIIAGFDNNALTNIELFQQFDAAIVGIHVAELMSSDPQFVSRIQPREIVEIIFAARKNNWKSLSSNG